MPQVRRTKLNAKDFKNYGFTPKCAGCNAMRNNLPNPGHNEECRERIEERLQESEEGRRRLAQAQHRSDVIMSRHLEQQQQHEQQQKQNKRQRTDDHHVAGTSTEQDGSNAAPASSSSSSGINPSSKRSAAAPAEGENMDEPRKL